MKRLILLLCLGGAVACAPAAELPTPVVPAEPPTQEAAAAPTAVPPTKPPPEVSTTLPEAADTAAEAAVPEPEATATEAGAAESVGVISGRTDEGAFFLGDLNAPITHIDYSDFL